MEREGSALDDLKRLDAQRLLLLRDALRQDQAETVNYLRMENPRVVQLLKAMRADQLWAVCRSATSVGVFRIDESKAFEDLLQQCSSQQGADAVDALRMALHKAS